MKKGVFIGMLIVLFMATSTISFGQESGGQESGEMKKPTMGKEAKESEMEMCRKYGMMKKMMSKQMVATRDGGVIVMFGNKLMKYDKNLNLKKEVKIDIDKKHMRKMMMHKKESSICAE